MSKNVAPDSLVKEAAEAVQLFRSSWRGVKEQFLEFGRACAWIEEKELHKYTPKEGSRKGYLSFDEFVDRETGGDCSRSMIFEAKRVFLLTLGPVPISREKLARMPRKSQLRVAKIVKETKDMAPEERSELIEKVTDKAVEQSADKFAATAQSVLNDMLPPEKQKAPLVRMTLVLDPTVAEKFKNLIEDFKLTPVVRSVMRDLDMTSAAVLSIIESAQIHASEILHGAKEKARREAPEIIPAAQATTKIAEAYHAPDFAKTVAAATEENRVVNRNDEGTLPS